MANIEHYPERIRIDRTTDTGRLLGPFSADRTNGRSDMDSCIYVRADLHRGAVALLDDLADVLARVRGPEPPDTAEIDALLMRATDPSRHGGR